MEKVEASNTANYETEPAEIKDTKIVKEMMKESDEEEEECYDF